MMGRQSFRIVLFAVVTSHQVSVRGQKMPQRITEKGEKMVDYSKE